MEEVGYCYMLTEREFISQDPTVVKIGMTIQPPNTRFKRLEDYKKGSKVLMLAACLDAPSTRTIEAALLKAFRRSFDKHTDGNEYFIVPSEHEAIRVFLEVIHKQYSTPDPECSEDPLEASIPEPLEVSTPEPLEPPSPGARRAPGGRGGCVDSLQLRGVPGSHGLLVP